MKTKALVFIVVFFAAHLVHAQPYVLEWEGPAGFFDGFKFSSESFDINNDGYDDLIMMNRDYESWNTIIHVYNPIDNYNLIWNYEIPAYIYLVGFCGVTSTNTTEMVYYITPEIGPNEIYIMDISTYNTILLFSYEGYFAVSICDIDYDMKDEILISEDDVEINHFEIWGDGTIGVDDNRNIQTPQFRLNQNYPNPFNPVTTINYQLEKSGYVELKIYNIQGQLIETLVNEKQNQGGHSVLWDAEGISSGMYFYEISVDGNLTAAKKAIHVK